MTDPPLRIAPTGDGLRLEGEIDISNAQQLREALTPLIGSGRDVVLDVSALTFMDSTAIQVLLWAGKAMPQDASLVLARPGPLVLNLLTLIRADRMPGLRIEAAP